MRILNTAMRSELDCVENATLHVNSCLTASSVAKHTHGRGLACKLRVSARTRQRHLAELKRRHRALEAEIVEARTHPSTDHLQIVELKRRKLLVKDEIARLQN
jgi:hypothetical protein